MVKKKKKDDLIEDSKKEIKKAVKTVKKNRKKIIISTILGVLILVTILLFLGIKIRFTLNNELDINLKPLEISIYTLRDVPNKFVFELENDNFFFCKSECTIEFWDISQNKLIDSQNVVLKSEENLEIEYVVSTDKKGEGQILFLFETECNNIKTAFCQTSGKKRFKSSIVTLNYRLNQKEDLLKMQLSKSLPEYLVAIKEADSRLRTEKAILEDASEQSAIENKIPQEFTSAIEKNKLDMDQLKIGKDRAENYRQKWSEQDYLGLEFNPILPDIMDNIDDLIERHNEVHILAINLAAWKLDDVLEFYTRMQDNDKIFDSNKLVAAINNEINTINSNDYEYVDTINRIKSLSEQISGANVQYLVDRENVTDKIALEALSVQRLLSENESSVTCQLITELNQKTQVHNTRIPIIPDYIKFKDDEVFNRILKQVREKTIIGDNRTINYTNQTYQQIDYTQLYGIGVIDDRLCHNVSVNVIINQLKSKSITKNNLPIKSDFSTIITDNKPECCFKGVCTECCENCKEPYPVIFIHGHASNNHNSPELSLAAFAKMQHRMEDYINAGQIDLNTNLDNIRQGEWGQTPRPLAVRASYYYISFYDIGAYSVTTRQTDSIENYAIRLKEIIDIVKEKTGREKVIIVAHSMGGLVAREYLVLFGEDYVDRMILVATPNHGVSGNIKKYCGLLGSDKECEDLAEDSIFLKRLNNPRNDPSIVVHTIAAVGCDGDFDGVVAKDSVNLDFATNHVIEGECTDLLGTDLHSNILDPDLYPETFELILSLLQ